MKSRVIVLLFLIVSPLSSVAFSQAAADVEALKAQIEAFRADYDKRLQALEMQLQALQGQTPAAPNPVHRHIPER